MSNNSSTRRLGADTTSLISKNVCGSFSPAGRLADNKSVKSRKWPPVIFVTNFGPIRNAFSRRLDTEIGREVVETSVGLVGKVNDDETEPRIAREKIKEMAGTGVKVLTNEGRVGLPDDATKLVYGDEIGGPTDILECSGTRRSERRDEMLAADGDEGEMAVEVD